MIAVAAATFAIPTFYPDQRAATRLVLFSVAVFANLTAIAVDLRNSRRTPQERELLAKLTEEKKAAAKTLAIAVTRRNVELVASQNVTRTLLQIESHRARLESATLPHIHRPLSYKEQWEKTCEQSLAELTHFWREQYFKNDRGTRVRATLFRVDETSVVPLRRSNGSRQSDAPQTIWNIGEGTVGLVARTGEPIFVPDVQVEIRTAKEEGRDPDVVIRRDEHARIRSILCLPLQQTDGALRGVLCVDAARQFPANYAKGHTPTPEHPIAVVQSFIPAFTSILLAQ